MACWLAKAEQHAEFAWFHPSDAELYDLLMTEYPGWLKLARGNGLLK